jgi:hypothetical protein
MCRGSLRHRHVGDFKTVSANVASPLEVLAEKVGRGFPHLVAARERTSVGLERRRARLGDLQHSCGTSVVLMGSWGRAEVTAESDDDFMVLVRGAERSSIDPSGEAIRSVLDRAPGDQGIFGDPVFSDNLAQNIGLDADGNANLTRRMLFLLESIPVTGDEVYEVVRDEVLDRYLNESIKPFRPPRFLLNDVVRYWRTICVDFAGKEHKRGPDKWGLRNAKLRTSRKILFAGGLLPVLECYRTDEVEMRSFLEQRLSLPPTDRIAQSFLDHGASDAGARTLGAYDQFVGHMNDQAFRDALKKLTREASSSSPEFAEMQRIGHELEGGLLALLYETRHLPEVVREYAIF